MLDFEYLMPTKLVFGADKINLIGKITNQYGNKALIVTGKNSTKKSGLLDRVLAILQDEKIYYVLFDKIQSNPLTTTAAEGAEVAKMNSCNVVIALGGGSSIDAAKGIAFLAENDGNISDYIFGKPGTGALPIIAVNTTSGTGSEADGLAVLTNPENNDKKSLKSIYIYPKVSIVDPKLMTTLPKKLIASTGLDALCHNMEAYVGRRATPIVEALALKAIKLISENLIKVYNDPQDLEAWSNMALASSIGGIVIDASGVALAHGLEHPVSGLLNVNHGEGLAAILINWMEYTYSYAPQKFSDIAEIFGENIMSLTSEEAALKSITAIKKLLEQLKLDVTLGSLGVSDENIEWLSNNAAKTMKYAIENNPRIADIEDIKLLYKKSL